MKDTHSMLSSEVLQFVVLYSRSYHLQQLTPTKVHVPQPVMPTYKWEKTEKKEHL